MSTPMNDVVKTENARRTEDAHVLSIVRQALLRSLETVGALKGNAQLANWRTGVLLICEQCGFDEEFLGHFRQVKWDDGSACGRSILARKTIMIADVMADSEFRPHWKIAEAAGFRAVQSTPMLSRSGAFIGVISTHHGYIHHPSEKELHELLNIGRAAADAVIRHRALSPGRTLNARVGTQRY